MDSVFSLEERDSVSTELKYYTKGASPEEHMHEVRAGGRDERPRSLAAHERQRSAAAERNA